VGSIRETWRNSFKARASKPERDMYEATYINSAVSSLKSTTDSSTRSRSSTELPLACMARSSTSYIQGCC
jgi:hypothetical protein